MGCMVMCNDVPHLHQEHARASLEHIMPLMPMLHLTLYKLHKSIISHPIAAATCSNVIARDPQRPQRSLVVAVNVSDRHNVVEAPSGHDFSIARIKTRRCAADAAVGRIGGRMAGACVMVRGGTAC